MLSKALIKLVNSLNYKKYRDQHQLFVAEGEKLVTDLIRLGAPIQTLILSNELSLMPANAEIIKCSANEIEKLSFLKSSQGVIALIEIRDNVLNINQIKNKLSLALDGIQDPGNMGTIIRLANWFGIEHILCSRDCVDVYNPKVVQASMGALFGVQIHSVDLPEIATILSKNNDFQIYGTFMQGDSIYTSNLNTNALMIMGNEGKGISNELAALVTKKISIPSFFGQNKAAESLNVGVATGIIVSEFKRQSVGRF